jgi:hypothetical protein
MLNITSKPFTLLVVMLKVIYAERHWAECCGTEL